MLGDFASLDVQNTYRGSDAYVFKVFSALSMLFLVTARPSKVFAKP
ncbi:hypothetical protein [Piscirickettsia salmonis]|nr:hypothetical protein [Piscirickettsia salmonis]QHS26442.1 hypothetical protein GW538_11635 [Piscirickettsia salmonis]QHS29644.1 hypothetical protein GW537_11775 [Piscirickettsia salmonis]